MVTEKNTLPLVLMERTDTEHSVFLVYHGAAANPKLTIEVEWLSGEFPSFSFSVPDADALDAFYHPYNYRKAA